MRIDVYARPSAHSGLGDHIPGVAISIQIAAVWLIAADSDYFALCNGYQCPRIPLRGILHVGIQALALY
jgi:hypothetical protein